jgi:hypothetical protein
MAITLDQEGDGFILGADGLDGKRIEMRLTAMDVLSLSQSAVSLEERILSQRDPKGGGASAIRAAIVEQFRVQSDSMGQDLLLTVQTPNGRRLTFAFPPHHADRLAREVPIEVAAQRAKKLTKQ